MSGLKEYYEQLSTQELESILRDDIAGTAEYSLDDILTVCTILAERSPIKRDAQESLRRFYSNYPLE